VTGTQIGAKEETDNRKEAQATRTRSSKSSLGVSPRSEASLGKRLALSQGNRLGTRPPLSDALAFLHWNSYLVHVADPLRR
jgi:hypothetical protein